MSDGIESKTTGLDDLVARMQRLAGTDTFSARLGATSSSGEVKRVRGGEHMETISRTPGENVTILRAQAKEGRDVAFIEPGKATAIWQRGIGEFMRAESDEPLLRAARDLGELAVEETRKHIDRSEGRDGPIAPVTPGTQARKDREVGPGKPPLVRTGQLYRSLVGESRRAK